MGENDAVVQNGVGERQGRGGNPGTHKAVSWKITLKNIKVTTKISAVYGCLNAVL